MAESFISARWLANRVPWVSTLFAKAAIEKCEGLKADGYFIIPTKRKNEDWRGPEEEFDPVFYFTKRPTYGELTEIRECQNYYAEVFSYTYVLAVLRPVVSDFKIIGRKENGELLFGYEVTWVEVDMIEQQKTLAVR